MMKKIAVLPFLAAAMLAPLPFALDRTDDGRESRSAVDQGTAETLSRSRGGWDHNGPDMFGMVDESEDTQELYRGGWDGNGPDEHGVLTEDPTNPVLYRGGWDYNGPEAAGSQPTQTTSANGLDILVVQAIELPSGDVIGSTRK